jgi:hypothetical protein
VVEVLFQVEEGVEEDWSHAAALEVVQRDAVRVRRNEHVQHLREFFKVGLAKGTDNLVPNSLFPFDHRSQVTLHWAPFVLGLVTPMPGVHWVLRSRLKTMMAFPPYRRDASLSGGQDKNDPCFL